MKIKQKKLIRLGKKTPSQPPPKGGGARAEKLKNPADEPPFYVRGQKAGSKWEYWVGLALEKLEEETGIRWDYQVPVYGGRMRSGGNVVDFLVYTPGMWTILDPMGRYWHTGRNEDREEMQDVARKKKWRLLAWFTDETPTRESVYSFLRNRL